MIDIYDKFFQLLRLTIGSSTDIPLIQKEEWKSIYEIAQKQSLMGVIFDGIQKMSDATKSAGDSMEMDINLLMNWMGICRQIEKRNHQLDEAVGKVTAWFEKKGFRSCILKGQGNALMYPCQGHRTAGDIDIWVSGKPSEVIQFVHSILPKEKASYHHISFPDINGIPVEVHYRPCYLQNPLHNHRLQKYFRKTSEEQFLHKVRIEEVEFAIPTARFNIIYQLVHIYNHLFQEGIGLRQIVDYYFVIEKWYMERTESTFLSTVGLQVTDKAALQDELKHLGLWDFAGAMMYVQHEALGLSEDKMIVPKDVERGKLLLEDILKGGNFGQYDKRYGFGRGFIGHNLQRLCRDLRLMRYYPAEALSEPIFRTWHFFWRIHNKRS